MIKDKVAIVTGGSEGIGFGIASALAAKGVHVYLVARTLAKLEKAKTQILQQGGKVDVRSADITNIDAMKRLIEEIYKDNGRLDIFVNNAGTWKAQSLDTPFADIWKLIEFDMKAPYEITHYLAGRFKDEKKNTLQILTTISQAALEVMGSGLGYGTAKMALASGLFHIQKDLEKEKVENIKLYRLYPNTVATDKMIESMKAHGVMDAVTVKSVANTVVDMLSDATPTRDVRVGYYTGRGIVRTYYPSSPDEFYHPQSTSDEVVDSDFNPSDLLK